MAWSRQFFQGVGAGLVLLAGCANPSGTSSSVVYKSPMPSEVLTLSRSPLRSSTLKPVPPIPRPIEPTLALPRWEEVGRSIEGQAIEAIRLGRGNDRMLLIGSVHGNEGEGVPLVERFVEYLRQNPTLLDGRTLLVVRDANPDGHRAGSRTNANGVDLNRNFPAGNWRQINKNGRLVSGSRPESEPETRAIVELLDSFDPHRIMVVHSMRAGTMVNYDGPARALAQAMARENGYEVTDYIGYPTPGSLGSYAGIDLRLPIITLELQRGIGEEQAWEENREALVAALRFGK